MNTEELKRLAEAATPGPWEVRAGVLRKIGEQQQIATIYRTYNSQFIAAANPAAVLELIRQRDELLAALKGVVADIHGLISESYGVVGLHLNGDVAPWGELESGGRFERLTSLDGAVEAIAKAEG